MIVTGGENVFAIEVESVLARHPRGRPGVRVRHAEPPMGGAGEGRGDA